MLGAEPVTCVLVNEWKLKIRFQAEDAGLFLASARSLAASFIAQSRL